MNSNLKLHFLVSIKAKYVTNEMSYICEGFDDACIRISYSERCVRWIQIYCKDESVDEICETISDRFERGVVKDYILL